MILNITFVLGLNALLFNASVHGFSEEAIFEDEDIYNQALPPLAINATSGITVPGTKWCGPGNTASDYDDLGMVEEVDKCCRAHDNCPDIIEAQSSLHGLNNSGIFPILSCHCEQKFLNCLQNVDSLASNSLGRVYFTARSQCFDNGHPILSCKEYQKGAFRRRCIRYKVDKKVSKIWQFYDMPFYSVNAASLSRQNLVEEMSNIFE